MHRETLNKEQLTREIGRRTRLRNADVARVLAEFMDVVTEHLADGERVELENFLVFEVRPLIRQGQTIQVLKVRPARKLRKSLQSSEEE